MGKMEDWELILANRILIANKHNRFVSCLTRGERGYGKSMYNLKVMSYVFQSLYNLDENDAWNMALDNFIFGPYEYMNKIKHNVDHDVLSPVWCLDDAGVHFTGMLFFLDPHLYALIQGSFDTLRTVTNALLLNTPFKEKLMTGLRQYDDREITLYISQQGSYNRKAVCIKWYRLPSGRREWYKEFEDHFSCYVPKWVYEKYVAKRKRYNKLLSDKWESRMKKIDI